MATDTDLLGTGGGSAPARSAPFLDGPSAAAILLMLLGEEEAATLLRHFDPDEVKTLGTAMFAVANASEGEVETALDRFVSQSHALSGLAVGAEPRIRKVMSEALGNVRADNLLAKIAPKSSAAALDLLRWMEVPTIAQVLSHEHPQVGAIILAVLSPEVAAAVLEDLDDECQADLVYRAARLDAVSCDAIADLEAILAAASDEQGQTPTHKFGGRSEAAKIVSKMKRPTSERLLKSLKKKDKALSQEIEDEMFVFEDLLELDSKNMGTVLRSADAAMIALALKGASQDLADRMLASMSARAAQTIQDEMSERGLVKRAEVEEAQKSIITIARALAADGTIMIGTGGDEYV